MPEVNSTIMNLFVLYKSIRYDIVQLSLLITVTGYNNILGWYTTSYHLKNFVGMECVIKIHYIQYIIAGTGGQHCGKEKGSGRRDGEGKSWKSGLYRGRKGKGPMEMEVSEGSQV